MYKTSLLIGTLFALTVVILGASNAHALKKIFTPELTNSFDTGVKYQFYHAFALLFLGLYAKLYNQSTKWITLFFTVGTLLFSGSIYALCFLKSANIIGLTGLGILTPIGGVCLIIGWLLLLLKVISLPTKSGL